MSKGCTKSKRWKKDVKKMSQAKKMEKEVKKTFPGVKILRKRKMLQKNKRKKSFKQKFKP